MKFDSLVNKKKIVLTCKNLQDGDIEVLAEVLEKSTAVEEINLMLNQITLSDDKFTDALARNKSLKILNLYDNKIGVKVCATNVYGICFSFISRTPRSSITSFSSSYSCANVQGVKRLAKALSNNKTLEQLNLEGAEMGDEGVKHLAAALMGNCALEVLILRGNNISDEGLFSLVTTLIFNTSLRVLLLGQNNISDAGADKLADLIEYNHVIDQIMLDSNKVSDIMDLKIRNALSRPNRKNVRDGNVLPKSLVENLITHKNIEIGEKDAAIASLEDEMSSLEATVHCKDQEIALLRQLEGEILILDQKIERRDGALAAKARKMAKKDDELASMAAEIELLKASLEKPLELLAEVLKRKDEEIHLLKTKISSKETKTPKKAEVAITPAKDTVMMADVAITLDKDTVMMRDEETLRFLEEAIENIDPQSPRSKPPSMLKERLSPNHKNREKAFEKDVRSVTIFTFDE
jgi:hypothetical protein